MPPTKRKTRDLSRRDYLITTSEAAALLGKSKRTLERWIQNGQIDPPLKAPNGYYYWPIAEVQRLRNELGALRGGVQ